MLAPLTNAGFARARWLRVRHRPSHPQTAPPGLRVHAEPLAWLAIESPFDTAPRCLQAESRAEIRLCWAAATPS